MTPGSPSSTLSATAGLRLGEIDDSNAGEMRQLFADVFNKPMSEKFWRWKYRAGSGHGLGVWDGDRLVAHYGGVGADIVLDGHAARAVQIVDVMVAASARQAVRQHSPFFLATSKFLERYIGYSQPYLLGYGFPSHRHLNLAQHLGLYTAVGEMSELTIRAGTSGAISDWLLRWITIDQHNISGFLPALQTLWQQMQHSSSTEILVCKEGERLRYRYLQHPENQYQVKLLQHRLTGQVQAVIVLKVEQERVLLMDVVTALPQVPRVLQLAAALVQQNWRLPLAFWLSTAHAEKLRIPGMELKSLPISTPANIWTAGPGRTELQDRWWLTAGDTDYL